MLSTFHMLILHLCLFHEASFTSFPTLKLDCLFYCGYYSVNSGCKSFDKHTCCDIYLFIYVDYSLSIPFLLGSFYKQIFILIKSTLSIFSFMVLWPPRSYRTYFLLEVLWFGVLWLWWIVDGLWFISVVLGFTSMVWSFTFSL